MNGMNGMNAASAALTVALVVALAIVAFSTLLAVVNLRRYRQPPASAAASEILVSVCVPARNEATNLEPCVRSLLAQTHAAMEVLVYDDHSRDETPAILARLCAEDPRVRRVETAPLPAGWNGKQFGCDRMGRVAAGDWLLFTDADVRFEPACVARTLAEALRPRGERACALVSTFPRQEVGSLGEAILIPLIHFILLSYLPLGRMRATLDPSASAGCGQFLLVRRDAWLASGGHAAFRNSMHDGIKLPRALRAHGFATDLFDGTDLVSCRMYRGFAATWRGFAKNAFEGLGSVALLVVVTILHVVGHVLPWIVLGWAVIALADEGRWPAPSRTQVALAATAAVLAIALRLALAHRFRQPRVGAMLHPVGIVLMTAIQWQSLILHVTGRRAWKGRRAGGVS